MNDIPLKINRLNDEEWEAATDEQRLGHILSGGALKVEQAQEILEQIDEDIAYEQRYLLAYISTSVSAEPQAERPSQLKPADAKPAFKTSALSPQPLPTLLPVEDA